MDGNLQLNSIEFRYLAVNFGPCGRKIAKLTCKFPSVWTENSVYVYKFPSVWTENSE